MHEGPGPAGPGVTGPSAGWGGVCLVELELHDVRVFAEVTFRPDAEGLTVLTGPNGSGKTTILEAIVFLGTHRSFRSADRDVMVRTGAERAIIRSRFEREGRPLTVESELAGGRAPRTLVNRRPATSRSALAQAVPVTVFSPEDLAVVQGPPARRRDLLDTTLRLMDTRAADDLDALERILRQRAALLRQAGGRLSPEVATTLDVWDTRLSETGERVVLARRALVADLGPEVLRAHADLTDGAGTEVVLRYRASWDGLLEHALAERRGEDLRRGVSTVGPHRDDLGMALGDRDARVQASQGEQRSIALALRLAVHRLVTARSHRAPILLLDDVFSELDPDRSRALVRHLPRGQAVLTTAAPLPEGADVAAVVDVRSLSVPR